VQHADQRRQHQRCGELKEVRRRERASVRYKYKLYLSPLIIGPRVLGVQSTKVELGN